MNARALKFECNERKTIALYAIQYYKVGNQLRVFLGATTSMKGSFMSGILVNFHAAEILGRAEEHGSLNDLAPFERSCSTQRSVDAIERGTATTLLHCFRCGHSSYLDMTNSHHACAQTLAIPVLCRAVLPPRT